MKITNRLGLPEPIVAAIANDAYTKGDAFISVSQLGSPPRQLALIEKHATEIVTDASDEIWALLGKAIHFILERAEMNELAELRLDMLVNGVKVSGKFDRFVLKDGVLTDYKVTSAYVMKSRRQGERHRLDDWEQDQNCYAELIEEAGGQVKQLFICAILRDWSKLEAMRDKDYPQKQVALIEMPLWPKERRREYMEKRVRLHQAARQSLPFCNEEERWTKPTTYALMKKGRQSALKVERRLPDLIKWATDKGHTDAGDDRPKPGITVEKRPGKHTRCEAYCDAAEFCDQWKFDPMNPKNASAEPAQPTIEDVQ